MAKRRESPSKRQLELRLSGQAFEIPPLWDVLLIGHQAPIGPEAAKRMAESLAPGQFELVRVQRAPVEALLVRKSLLKALAAEPLVELLLEELAPLLGEDQVVRAQVEIVLHTGRTIRLE
ncbi:hypothetical protein [Thermus thermamylovorans]|uniref:Uncharacterized protein n=1 Tax=Thermus thermamylovorans TaxID=2509362 RepID=A0A4Q9B700_9DEIN|nr:hypothetical protein [Thermus thermamylovorans]TBH20539.1 hypothetical protein ETP66_06970 [Thermus thermamylovorans]